jgi:two-component system alkaline phosphatase synthesis response regulator PhoP
MGKKMLIVDDEEDILIFLSYYFNKNGFIVTTASDGVTGLLEFGRETFDIVITDIRMPNMDGIEMCNEIKKQNTITPIVFLTAVTDDYKILHAMRTGASQFVDKPIKLDVLTDIINGLIENKKKNK